MSFDNEYFDINTTTPCDYCNNYEFGCQKQGHRRYVLDIDFIFNNDDKAKCMYFEAKDFKAKYNEAEDNKEMINHPQHYNMGKFEAIDVIEDWQLNFNLGNTVKYISRAGHKDNIIQDLKKALWYLDREIKRLEKGE